MWSLFKSLYLRLEMRRGSYKYSFTASFDTLGHVEEDYQGNTPSTGKAFLHWLQKELQSFINKYMNTYCSTHTPTGDHQEELGRNLVEWDECKSKISLPVASVVLEIHEQPFRVRLFGTHFRS